MDTAPIETRQYVDFNTEDFTDKHIEVVFYNKKSSGTTAKPRDVIRVMVEQASFKRMVSEYLAEIMSI